MPTTYETLVKIAAPGATITSTGDVHIVTFGRWMETLAGNKVHTCTFITDPAAKWEYIALHLAVTQLPHVLVTDSPCADCGGTGVNALRTVRARVNGRIDTRSHIA